MSAEDLPDDSEELPDPEDAPEVKEHPGPWDEVVNRGILLAPWVALVLLVAWLVVTGTLTTDIRITGSVSAAPLVYGAAGLVGLTYLLALMKFYGASPITWVANAAAAYNPGENE